MSVLLAASLWAIWQVLLNDGKVVAESRLFSNKAFPSFAECESEMQRQVDFLEREGAVKRLGPHEFTWLNVSPDPEHKIVIRWECREAPPASISSALVSDVVRQFSCGKGIFLPSDRCGDTQGFEEPVALFNVYAL